MLSIQTAPTGPLHHTFLLTAVAFLIVAALLVIRIYSARLCATLLPQRPDHTEDSFVHHVASIGLNPRIARTTYRYLQRTRKIRFPILIGDVLDQDLGLDRHAVTETVRALLFENNREVMPNYRRSAIITVGDLIGFIQSSPQTEMDLAA